MAHLNKFQRISLNFNLTDLLLGPFQSLNYGTGTLPVLHYCREYIQQPLYSPFCPLEGIQYLQKSKDGDKEPSHSSENSAELD